MKYANVCLESFGYTLPEEIISSEEIERRLQPLYDRLRLPPGRLELMTGIRQRRFWPPGELPSVQSAQSAERAIQAAGLEREKIGALIHASVCRDHLEPATACSVHHRLGLSSSCLVYDVSNACLGLINGALQIANMIELEQIQAGLVVGTEAGRHLVEGTIESLNRDLRWTRRSVKSAIASLTIGSASCALLLTHRRISQTQNRLFAAAATSHTQFHRLCQSGSDEAVGGWEKGGMRPWMQTDSEQLLQEGVAAAVDTFKDFLEAADCSNVDIDKTVCHQVGSAHRKLLLEGLSLSEDRDFITYPWLGNTGSAALPISTAIALEQGFIDRGETIAMLGIGSGINCVMLGARWQETKVGSDLNVSIPGDVMSSVE